jgi:hypothetical protein
MNSSKLRTLSSGGCRAESIQIKRDRMEALEMQLRNLLPNAIKSKTRELKIKANSKVIGIYRFNN